MPKLAMLAAAAFLAGCGHARLRPGPGQDGEAVEVEGWAPLDAADKLGTQRRALADAERKAVEKVLGVYISAKTRVDQAVDVDQRILAKVEGYIGKYDVLSEREEEGFLKTRIEALVLYKKVGEDLKQLGLTRPAAPPGNPRVAVILRERDGRPGDEAAQGLRAALLAKGFAVVDRKEMEEFSGPKSTDAASAAAAGKALAADLVVRGECEVHPIDNAVLPAFHSARARAAVEVLKPKTGEVVAGQSREVSMLDPSEEVAESKALESAGSLVGEALIQDLAPLVKSRIGVLVRVAGLKGLDQVRSLADDIRLNPGVAAVTLADFREGLAELQVTTEAIPGNDLAAMILRSKKLRLKARSATAYLVELESD